MRAVITDQDPDNLRDDARDLSETEQSDLFACSGMQ